MRLKSPYIREYPGHYSGSRQNESSISRSKRRLKNVIWFMVPEWVQHNNASVAFGHCPVNECNITYQNTPTNLKSSDAILFTAQDAGRRIPVPVRAHKDQVYIFFNMESPLNTDTRFRSKPWNSAFNWTITYRTDSYVWQPVGFLKRAQDVPPLTYFVSLAKKKTKAAAWFVSNCKSKNYRERYARELQKLNITLDIFGKCGTRRCRKNSRHCLPMLTDNYFFYLAFENSHCQDYVTEKFLLNTFSKGIHVVPIVRGGANYSRYFPRGTYIDVDWFQGPEELAQFLTLLAEDTLTYAKFLWRKAHFLHCEHGARDGWCQLCDKLHHLDDSRYWYPDLYQWFAAGKCKPTEQFEARV